MCDLITDDTKKLAEIPQNRCVKSYASIQATGE